MKFFLSECILFKLLTINALELLFYKLRKIKGNRSLTKTVRLSLNALCWTHHW
jgi:hypothetical protein